MVRLRKHACASGAVLLLRDRSNRAVRATPTARVSVAILTHSALFLEHVKRPTCTEQSTFAPNLSYMHTPCRTSFFPRSALHWETCPRPKVKSGACVVIVPETRYKSSSGSMTPFTGPELISQMQCRRASTATRKSGYVTRPGEYTRHPSFHR